MDLTAERSLRAIEARDARFDGWFFFGVTSTGIYCRPSCPARAPRLENITIHKTAAAAQRAGYRACKRCRPDVVPGSPEWDRRADVVARAVRMINDGVVDRDGVTGLAERLGYSTRQVTRLVTAELGVGPLALARSDRARTARVLIETTDVPLSEVAFAAGFSSIRQFNDTVREVFATTPSQMRRRPTRPPGGADQISLRLAMRQPFFAPGLFARLSSGGVRGVEVCSGERYTGSVRLAHGLVIVHLVAQGDHVRLNVRLEDLRDLASAVGRCRALLDLDADPVAIDGDLETDRALSPLVRASPGRRVLGSLDPESTALRAVLGQQVSTRAAATAAGRLARILGEPIASSSELEREFPTAAAIAEASDDDLAMPASRRDALRTLARSLAEGAIDLGPGCDRQAAVHALGQIKGIGPWTVGVIAMRALRDPDVFLENDAVVAASAQRLGLVARASGLRQHAQRWRPWRSYAVEHLWGLHATTAGTPVSHPAPSNSKETT